MNSFFITDIGSLALPQPFVSNSAATDLRPEQGTALTPPPPITNLPTEPVKVLHDVWIKIEEGYVAEVGPEGNPKPAEKLQHLHTYSAQNRLVTPGFVDAHTHPVFVDWRQREFVMRSQGRSYQEIAEAGGGIRSSVKGVRETSRSELVDLIGSRLNRFLELGTTSIEAKSGYGLSLDAEIKSLEALQTAGSQSVIDVSPTLLGAHVIPEEYSGRMSEYIDLVCEQMIPKAAEENLAESVDVFLEKGAFDLESARRVFEAGQAAGLRLRIHADQFNARGGAELAAEFGALTADHMDRTTPEGMDALANSGITVVLLPGAVFFLGMDQYAPASEMIRRGCRIALATDFNPGTSPTMSMPLMMTLACIKMGLTPNQALWAGTMGGAYAINRETAVGSLMPGFQADFCIWDTEDVDFIAYAYGNMIPQTVFKKGQIVAQKGELITT